MDLAELAGLLRCPVDRSRLSIDSTTELVCTHGHRFPVDNGAPVLFDPGLPQPIHASFDVPAEVVVPRGPLPNGEVDPYVQSQVAGTCGNLYLDLIGKLTAYPIPNIPLDSGSPDQVLVDIGANWGRWSIAAARLGYRVVSVEPWPAGSQAAARVAQQLGLADLIGQVRADAVALPFDDNSVDVVFSYSVIQHFARDVAADAFHEAARVLKPGGLLKIQMPNRRGLRQTWNRYRNSEEEKVFGVRMWSLSELAALAQRCVGPASFAIDGFFGLGVQAADMGLLSARHRAIVRSSLLLQGAARHVPMLTKFADSVWVTARKP